MKKITLSIMLVLGMAFFAVTANSKPANAASWTSWGHQCSYWLNDVTKLDKHVKADTARVDFVAMFADFMGLGVDGTNIMNGICSHSPNSQVNQQMVQFGQALRNEGAVCASWASRGRMSAPGYSNCLNSIYTKNAKQNQVLDTLSRVLGL